MKTFDFIWNHLLGVLISSFLIAIAYILFTSNFSEILYVFPAALMFALVALVLSLPYSIIMIAVIISNETSPHLVKIVESTQIFFSFLAVGIGAVYAYKEGGAWAIPIIIAVYAIIGSTIILNPLKRLQLNRLHY